MSPGTTSWTGFVSSETEWLSCRTTSRKWDSVNSRFRKRRSKHLDGFQRNHTRHRISVARIILNAGEWVLGNRRGPLVVVMHLWGNGSFGAFRVRQFYHRR